MCPVSFAEVANTVHRAERDFETYDQDRLARFGAIALVGFVAAVALLYAFAWLADQVLEQETQALDLATLHDLQQFGSPQLTFVAQVVSMMGSQVVVVIAAILLIVFVAQRRWSAALTLILVTAGAQVLNDILKQLFHRARPVPLAGLIEAQQFSFPSGHAMVSAAFYLYLAYLSWRLLRGRWRGVLAIGLILLVLLIGLARLYLEAHYLTDVVAGYFAGILWTDSIILGNRALSVRRHRPVRPGLRPG